MDADDVGNFLSRWSRRKLGKEEPPKEPAKEPERVWEPAAQPAREVLPPEAMEPSHPELPAVETLTPESDFKPFMQAEVDPGVKQAALKQLFKDPHFNVMDGLDTYIDDYSVADPIPDAMMKTLYQAREHLFTPEEKAAADAADAKAAEDKASGEIAQVPDEYLPPPDATDQA
jgi:hypothetical protein